MSEDPPGPLAALCTRLVIRRMGWSEPVFRGVAADERGRREAYRIVRPARALIRPRARRFDALVVESWARFGNAVVQVANAIEGARRLGARRVLLPAGHDIFGVSARVAGIDVAYGGAPDLDAAHTALVGRFFHARAVGCRAGTRPRRDLVAQAVRGLIQPEILAPDPRVEAGDAVAHLRSGDVFRPDTRAVTYGQPPTAHYLAAIAASGARRVWVVYEDRVNPSIDALVVALRARGITVIEQSATLAEDLRLMLSARRLVIGRSTLGDAIAALSRSLTDLYVFGRQRAVLPSGSAVVQHRTVDVSGDYIAAVQNGNWHNTEAQRRLMVTYPESALRIEREPGGVRVSPPDGSAPTA